MEYSGNNVMVKIFSGSTHFEVVGFILRTLQRTAVTAHVCKAFFKRKRVPLSPNERVYGNLCRSPGSPADELYHLKLVKYDVFFPSLCKRSF